MIVQDGETLQVFLEGNYIKHRVVAFDNLGEERFYIKLERWGWVEVDKDDYLLAQMFLRVEASQKEIEKLV